jgi:WD40 repeat protein
VAVPAVPYRGIQPFRYVDHAIFLAREEETEELEDLVAIYRGVLLYGASGDGKSSLINAGLLPAAGRRRLHAERVRVQPRAGEEIVIERIATTEDDVAEHLPSLLAPEGDESSRIIVSVHAFEERVREACASHRPLLIFDQFEEIITLFEDEAAVAVQRDIAAMLIRLLHEPLAVKLLFVFREDYLSKVKHLLAAVPELVDQALRLDPLSADALPTIIRGPFERHPGHFTRELDPDLARRVCAALEERFGSSDLSLSEVETVALRLWESDDPQALLAERGVQGILEDYLGEALDAFSPELRAAAIALLAQMVTSAGTRNVISAEDLVQRVREEDRDLAPAPLSEALERLERESRLIRRERRRDIYLYEITSEFLVPWISQRREEARLVQERRRAEQRREQERTRERRRLRVLGSIAGGLLVFAAVVALLAVWALGQRNEARSQSAEAQLQASNVTSLALTSAATQLRSTRPDLSLLLALEAYREKQRAEARGSVFAALTAARGSGEVAGILRSLNDDVSGVAFSPDGHTLVSGGGDGAIQLWDTHTNKQMGATLRVPPDEFGGSMAFSTDGRRLAFTGGGVIRLWDTRTHKQLGPALRGYQGRVAGPAFSRDGHTLAFASNNVIRLWDTRTHKQLGSALPIYPGALRGAAVIGPVPLLAFGPNGHTLASATGNVIRLWDTRTHKQLGPTLRTQKRTVLSLAFSPDGHTLASGNYHAIRLWDTRTHKQLGPTLRIHKGSIGSVAFSPDGRTLASTSDKTIWLWDTRTHKQRGPTLRGHTANVDTLVFSPDGRTLASGSADQTIRLWDIRAHMRPRPTLRTHKEFLYSVGFSANGRTLAATSDQAIRLWDTLTRRRLGPKLRIHKGSFGSVAFSSDERTLATAGGRAIELWDTRTHKPLGPTLRIHKGSIGSVAFSPDGHTLASTSDKTIRLWDTRTHKQLGAALRGHTETFSNVVFSPDGHTLASTSDKTIRLWDTRTHKQRGPALGRYRSAFGSLAFSPDGRMLAFGSDFDGAIHLWDTRTHKQLNPTLRGGDLLFSLAFSPDGHTLASGAWDGKIRLWDTRSRKQVGPALRTGEWPGVVAFMPDGRTLASASAGDARIRLWKNILWRDVADLRRQVCQLVGSGLSKMEWTQYATGIPYRKSCP